MKQWEWEKHKITLTDDEFELVYGCSKDDYHPFEHSEECRRLLGNDYLDYMPMCIEMLKLRKELNKRHIHWHDCSEPEGAPKPINRTWFHYNHHEYSVVNGVGTSGGYNVFFKKNLGLLELMIDDDDPIGFLKAKDVLCYL